VSATKSRTQAPTATERAAAIARSLLERYGVVLREAAGAEGLPGGFGYVYDVYRAMEEQGRLRRGYFVAGRGATQFALPGAEERLRMPKKAEEEGTKPIILAATDPANPWGSLLPWPSSVGRTPMRAPGARVVLAEGRLLAWMSRGGKNITTFLGDDELASLHDARLLARTIAAAPGTVMIETIDGEEAPQSRMVKVLYEHGFKRRQSAFVRIPSFDPNFRQRRLGAGGPAPVTADVGIPFDFTPIQEEEEAEALDDVETSFDTDFTSSELDA
jgi:ATP-dependent Lhr-like helicase